jgi:type III pantothenate kinase
MLLVLDIGNTNTHLGLTANGRAWRQTEFRTTAWQDGRADRILHRFVSSHSFTLHNRNSNLSFRPSSRSLTHAALCSVVPRAAILATRTLRRLWKLSPFQLTHQTVRGIGIDYPRPEAIGPDRLANAIAVSHYFGRPAVVVDFGTAVTFDVVNREGNYVGGIIAPGLAAMTDYLHEKTALLPRIRIRDTRAVIGRNTEQAMLIGAVHGYRGLIRELLGELKVELKARRLTVVATGGYARLMAARLPEISAVDPLLTLKGIQLAWEGHQTFRGY